MKEEQKDLFFDLLASKAVYGLDAEAQRQLEEFDQELTELELASLERTAVAISLVGMNANEQMPPHIFARIADDAQNHIMPMAAERSPVSSKEIVPGQTSGTPWFSWLGWAVAAAACIALAFNIFVTSPPKPEIAQTTPPLDTQRELTLAERREEMLQTPANMVKAEWALGNVKDIKTISGDVVWSDELQAGYMRFRGLPANDPNKETYQLWIFDKTQDKATPIDGGTFDIPADGEVIVPINAKLRAKGAEMFAVTIEKPGGVVVSKREKIAALAKVETRSS